METAPAPKRSLLFRLFRWGLIGLFALVTLVMLLYAIENFRGKRAWEAYRQEAEARGLKLKFEQIIPPPVPEDQNAVDIPFVHSWFATATRGMGDTNLWPADFSRAHGKIRLPKERNRYRMTDLVAWNEAFSRLNSGESTKSDDPKLRWESRSAAEQARAAQGVLEALKIYDPALDQFRATMSRPHARYPIDYNTEQPFAILLPHLAKVKSLSQTLTLRASANLAAGNTNAAFDDVRLGFRLANSVAEEGFLISELVRIACVQILLQPVWEGIAQHRWSGEQLKDLQAHFTGYAWMPRLARSLEAERASAMTTIDWLKEKKSGERLGALMGDSVEGAASGLSLMPRGWWEMEKVNYSRFVDGWFEHVNEHDPGKGGKSFEMTEPKRRMTPIAEAWNHELLSALLLPAMSKSQQKFAAAQVATDLAAVACALERARLATGSYPDSLDALAPKWMAKVPVDFITAEPLKYRREGDGYVLYSVGWDEEDDEGRPGKTLFDPNQGDWVWEVPQPSEFE